jgi:N-methylhydantoinase A
MATHLRVGIDMGGTFTDFVVWDAAAGALDSFKILSTPEQPEMAILQGLSQILGEYQPGDISIIHGSTVATNGLLERKGPRTALITTSGFGDVLQIGRQNRPALYDLFASPEPPLIPRELRFEVDERIDKNGQAIKRLQIERVDQLVDELRAAGAQSLAVCLLFSFANPAHEQQIASRLREAGCTVSVSSEILPEFREYERASTTAVNAYVSPLLSDYLSNLESSLGVARPAPGQTRSGAMTLEVMQSNGGIISPAEAQNFGVRCILSGPAGGVVGCEYVARLGLTSGPAPVRVITFDMGGTSTDVSLIEGHPGLTSESNIAGCPIHIPMLDIHTIGAGGGSIASVDAGGALRVGPESAGADPGPACYGRRLDSLPAPTVTDANLVLGRLAPENFLGGRMPLNTARSWEALSRLGSGLGLEPTEAALGILQIANAHMERALRVISVERGHDPREFVLLSFGGAGGLHCADLARGLGVSQVLIPPLASTLSALGMLAADVARDYTQTVMLPEDTAHEDLARSLENLAERGRVEVEAQGIPPERVRVELALDMRYRGQSYELTVDFGPNFRASFHDRHQQVYGYFHPDKPVEIVNLRVRATGQIDPPALVESVLGDENPSPALFDARPVIFAEGEMSTPFYRSEWLRAGNRLQGPAIIVRADTTVLIGPCDRAQMDGFGNLIMDVGPG